MESSFLVFVTKETRKKGFYTQQSVCFRYHDVENLKKYIQAYLLKVQNFCGTSFHNLLNRSRAKVQKKIVISAGAYEMRYNVPPH